MSARRRANLAGSLGFLWSLCVLWVAVHYVTLPVFVLVPTVMTAFLAPGLVLLVMIIRISLRRYADDALLGGKTFAAQSAGDIDQRVLRNSIEQLVLGLCIWPAAAVLLANYGPGVITLLGINFALTRLAFWFGYHKMPALKSFGFAAGFFPTLLVAFWCIWMLF